MSDHPPTDWTECDGCNKRVYWLATTRWLIIHDRCYCTGCRKRFVDPAPQRGQIVQKKPVDQDRQYHGGYYE